MEISNQIRAFLNREEIQKLINNNQFNLLYSFATDTFSPYIVHHIRELTEILYASDINPLHYMNKIPNYYLYESDIKEFIIPDNIKIIGAESFMNNFSLQSIEIPDSVERIGEYAFYGCPLTHLVIGKGIKTIGRYAFNVPIIGNENTDIVYNGTKDQFNKISIDFKKYMGNIEGNNLLSDVPIKCIDGIIY